MLSKGRILLTVFHYKSKNWNNYYRILEHTQPNTTLFEFKNLLLQDVSLNAVKSFLLYASDLINKF